MDTKMLAFAFIIRIRRNMKYLLSLSEQNQQELRWLRREQKKLAADRNRFNKRRAALMEPEIASMVEWSRLLGDRLYDVTELLLSASGAINASLSQQELMDVLEINPADRTSVEDGDGIVELTFARSLEHSAMYRGSDWKRGVITESITSYMCKKYIRDAEFKKASNDMMFGKGGMFEFLPVYRHNENGEMVRQPPKLRLAETCDIK